MFDPAKRNRAMFGPIREIRAPRVEQMTDPTGAIPERGEDLSHLLSLLTNQQRQGAEFDPSMLQLLFQGGGGGSGMAPSMVNNQRAGFVQGGTGTGWLGQGGVVGGFYGMGGSMGGSRGTGVGTSRRRTF